MFRSGPGGGGGGGAGSKPLVVLQIKRPRKLKENCTAQLAGVIQPIKKASECNQEFIKNLEYSKNHLQYFLIQ